MVSPEVIQRKFVAREGVGDRPRPVPFLPLEQLSIFFWPTKFRLLARFCFYTVESGHALILKARKT